MACCTVSGVETVEAEEVAIVLDVSQRGAKVVISDSKNAVRNYESGRVAETAIRILNRDGGPRQLVLLVWAPAHQGLRGNEKAHSVARGLTYRSTPGTSQVAETINRREDMRAYKEITPQESPLRIFRNIFQPFRECFKHNVSGTPDEQHSEIFRRAQGVRLAYNALLANFRAASPDYDVFSTHWPDAQWAFFVRVCMVHCTADQTPRPLTPRERCLLPLHNMDEFAGAFECRTKPGFIRGSCLM
ncbi:hypothetical protein HPB49_021827 [Dermacentor silvarum]|uniref:Uncharacterized protein n=1 Tax=Dermacentor silvarum TaxID=543639 RepID=A0ACB8D049_DERSI|nr:hypothetical protein HPB49_021827 [Dermacentor silvarum]